MPEIVNYEVKVRVRTHIIDCRGRVIRRMTIRHWFRCEWNDFDELWKMVSFWMGFSHPQYPEWYITNIWRWGGCKYPRLVYRVKKGF